MDFGPAAFLLFFSFIHNIPSTGLADTVAWQCFYLIVLGSSHQGVQPITFGILKFYLSHCLQYHTHVEQSSGHVTCQSIYKITEFFFFFKILLICCQTLPSSKPKSSNWAPWFPQEGKYMINTKRHFVTFKHIWWLDCWAERRRTFHFISLYWKKKSNACNGIWWANFTG